MPTSGDTDEPRASWPTPVPTCVVQGIGGPTEAEDRVTIDEDDCKLWKVTGLIKSLTARRQCF